MRHSGWKSASKSSLFVGPDRLRVDGAIRSDLLCQTWRHDGHGVVLHTCAPFLLQCAMQRFHLYHGWFVNSPCPSAFGSARSIVKASHVNTLVASCLRRLRDIGTSSNSRRRRPCPSVRHSVSVNLWLSSPRSRRLRGKLSKWLYSVVRSTSRTSVPEVLRFHVAQAHRHLTLHPWRLPLEQVVVQVSVESWHSAVQEHVLLHHPECDPFLHFREQVCQILAHRFTDCSLTALGVAAVVAGASFTWDVNSTAMPTRVSLSRTSSRSQSSIKSFVLFSKRRRRRNRLNSIPAGRHIVRIPGNRTAPTTSLVLPASDPTKCDHDVGTVQLPAGHSSASASEDYSFSITFCFAQAIFSSKVCLLAPVCRRGLRTDFLTAGGRDVLRVVGDLSLCSTQSLQAV